MENKIDQLKTEVEDIRKSLKEMTNSVTTLSESEMKKQMEKLKERAGVVSQKIKDEINKLSNKTDESSKKIKEGAESLLNSLEEFTKEVSDLYNSIVCNLSKGKDRASEQVDKGKDRASEQVDKGKKESKNILKKGRERIVERGGKCKDRAVGQWENAKENPGKYIGGLAIGIVGFFGIKWLWNKVFGKKKHEKGTETNEQGEKVQGDDSQNEKSDKRNRLGLIYDWFRNKVDKGNQK